MHALSKCYVNIISVATVGLKRTLYRALENDGVVEVCAVVVSPNILCPIEFPFIISFSTTDSSAGANVEYRMEYTLIELLVTVHMQVVQQIMRHSQ